MTKRLIFLATFAAILTFYFAVSFEHNIAEWHMINVNSGKLQGDANLIILGDTVVMIDAGYSSEAKAQVIPYLKKLKIKTIDHFFISHPHRDHYEGMAPILDAGIKITNLYYKIPAPEIKDCCYDKKDFQKFIDYAKDHGTNLISPKTGFVLELDKKSSIEILHAQEGNLGDIQLDVNDLSLIMKLNLQGDRSVLFPGDLNLRIGSFLSGRPEFQADFLKMPHHGLTGIAPNSFLDTVNPDYVLVPGPKYLWCSKRGAQERSWIKEHNKPTWINGLNGHIKVEWKKDRVGITAERENDVCESNPSASDSLIKN